MDQRDVDFLHARRAVVRHVDVDLGQAPGFAGPPDAKAQQGLSKYIITDMYAKAVQGMPAEDSVKWAESELKKIYAA